MIAIKKVNKIINGVTYILNCYMNIIIILNDNDTYKKKQ